MIEIGAVYGISPVQVRVWNKAKKLATLTQCSFITPVTDGTTSQLKFQKKTDQVTK